MALQTSPESPAPVRQVATLLAGWIDRLGAVWVEGQVAQLSRRQGMSTVFLTLRDTVADVSVTVTCSRVVFDSLNPPVVEGAGVVVHGRPRYYPNRGTLSLVADDLRMVGLGELLARLERRRQLLAAEGLFARELKRALPFLPGTVGLVTARGSAAERDVLDNARRRWPAVAFRVAPAAMQGPTCARQVIEALGRLDRDPEVEVIVVARGGGSVEDLLPFSDEALVRAVHSARTPVVSAIGHESDTPLLDLVADVRASTPTDAAKLVVPDVAEETQRVRQLRDRCRTVVGSWLAHEERQLASLRARPCLSDPASGLSQRSREVTELRDRARRSVGHRLDRATDDVAHALARVRGLSPLATLARGYAVLLDEHGHVVTRARDVAEGRRLTARLHEGRLDVAVERTHAGGPDAPEATPHVPVGPVDPRDAPAADSSAGPTDRTGPAGETGQTGPTAHSED